MPLVEATPRDQLFPTHVYNTGPTMSRECAYAASGTYQPCPLRSKAEFLHFVRRLHSSAACCFYPLSQGELLNGFQNGCWELDKVYTGLCKQEQYIYTVTDEDWEPATYKRAWNVDPRHMQSMALSSHSIGSPPEIEANKEVTVAFDLSRTPRINDDFSITSEAATARLSC